LIMILKMMENFCYGVWVVDFIQYQKTVILDSRTATVLWELWHFGNPALKIRPYKRIQKGDSNSEAEKLD
jgi:hypothetical protein